MSVLCARTTGALTWTDLDVADAKQLIMSKQADVCGELAGPVPRLFAPGPYDPTPGSQGK